MKSNDEKKPITADEIQELVSAAVEEARDFIDGDISKERIKAERYFNGECDIPAEEKRSKSVDTKCRDAVRQTLASIMRVFFTTEQSVEFIPDDEDRVQMAEQATDVISDYFRKANGFRVLETSFKDALIKKAGIVKVSWEDTENVEYQELEALNPLDLAMMITAEGLDVVEYDENEDGTLNVKLARVTRGGKVCFDSVPPEEFFISPNARDLESAKCCGNATEMTISDLLEMGFSEGELEDLDNESEDEEDQERNNYQLEDDESADPSMKEVLVTEAYMKMDIEGTGIARLYKFILGGTNFKVLDYEEAEDKPYAIFEVDPIPHTFFGRSLVELIFNDQDVGTVMLRGLLDNTILSNNPGMAVNSETGVNMKDVLNKELGRIIRTKGSPAGQFQEFTVPNMAATSLPVMQYFNQQTEARTGVASAAVGLNPDALQSTTAAGVHATVQAAEGQTEVMIRHLAEGVRQMYRLALRVLHRQQPEQSQIMLNGQGVQYEAGQWDPEMDMRINVGLGTGGEETRMVTLQAILGYQQQVMQSLPGMGIVTPTHVRNTLADIATLGKLPNVTRYFGPMNPEIERQIQQQQAQQAAQNPPPDPNAAVVQVAQAEIEQKAQAAQAETMRKATKDAAEINLKATEIDLKQDGMLLDAMQTNANVSQEVIPLPALKQVWEE